MRTLKSSVAALAVIGTLLATAPAASSLASAPILSSEGATLKWTAVPGATQYRLTEVTASGTVKNFYLGNVLSYTPARVPGGAVFRVKSRPPQWSNWSNSVTVVYPQAETSQKEREESEAREREAKEKAEQEAKEKAEREARGGEAITKEQEELELREAEELARKGPITLVSPTGPFDCAGRLSSECEYQLFGCNPPLCSTSFKAPEPLSVGSEQVGPLSTIATAKGYEELFARIRSLHDERKSVVLAPGGAAPPELEYGLATFLLFDDGHDYISEAANPIWSGWFAHFGFTVQGVRRFSGLWSRSTSEGWAIVALPGTATQTIVLPYAMTTPAGYRVSSITLSGGQGAVLQCNPIPSRGDCPGYGSYGETEEVPASLNPFPFA